MGFSAIETCVSIRFSVSRLSDTFIMRPFTRQSYRKKEKKTIVS